MSLTERECLSSCSNNVYLKLCIENLIKQFNNSMIFVDIFQVDLVVFGKF